MPSKRIAQYLAHAGVCSRRKAEIMIKDGRISVDGETLTSPAVNVHSEQTILVDGKPILLPDMPRLWRYHKPRGLVTTHDDPAGRVTVFQRLPPRLPRVMSIGRLDINTEGLLLLTNNGALQRHLELPATGWLRRYRVRAYGRADADALAALSDGISIDGVRYRPIAAVVERIQGDNLWLTMSVREGKNREVKKVLEHMGLAVNRLIRVAFGPFQLGNLAVGMVEEIPLRILKEQLGAAWDGVAAGTGAPRRSGFEPKKARAKQRVDSKPRGDKKSRFARSDGVHKRHKHDNSTNKKPRRHADMSRASVRGRKSSAHGDKLRTKPASGRGKSNAHHRR